MEYYFIIGTIFGVFYYIFTSANLIFDFTDIPLFRGMFENKTKSDLFYNLFVLLFTSFALIALWPCAIVFTIMYYSVFLSTKKK